MKLPSMTHVVKSFPRRGYIFLAASLLLCLTLLVSQVTPNQTIASIAGQQGDESDISPSISSAPPAFPSLFDQYILTLFDESAPSKLRVEAATALFDTDPTAAITQFTRILHKTCNTHLSRSLIAMLGTLPNEQTRSIFLDLAITGNTPKLRYTSIQSLLYAGNTDQQTITMLKQVAANDSDKYNRARAILALARIDDPAIPEFLDTIQDDEENAFVRHVCDQIIAKRGME